MKFYDYKCNSCKLKFENFTIDNEDIICPKCGSFFVERLPSAPGMVKSNFADKVGFKNREN